MSRWEMLSKGPFLVKGAFLVPDGCDVSKMVVYANNDGTGTLIDNRLSSLSSADIDVSHNLLCKLVCFS